MLFKFCVLECICVGCGHVSAGAGGGQRSQVPLNLQLQAVEKCFTRGLGNKPGSLQEKCALNHWVISQDPWQTFSLSVKGLHGDQDMHCVSLLSTYVTMALYTFTHCMTASTPLHPASCLWKSALGLEGRGSPFPLILGDRSPWAPAKSVN